MKTILAPLVIAVLFLIPTGVFAEAWTFTYSHGGKTYTYPTRYASRQEASDAFRAWRRERYSGQRNPPQLVRLNYLADATPDRNRRPY